MPGGQAAFGAGVYLLIEKNGVINGSLGHVTVVNVQVLLLPLPHAGRVLSEAVWPAQRFAHSLTIAPTHDKERVKDVVKSFEEYVGVVIGESFKPCEEQLRAKTVNNK